MLLRSKLDRVYEDGLGDPIPEELWTATSVWFQHELRRVRTEMERHEVASQADEAAGPQTLELGGVAVDEEATARKHDSTTRGIIRGCLRACAIGCVAVLPIAMARAAQTSPTLPASPPPPFHLWLTDLIGEAVGRGFDRRLVNQALSGLQPLPRVIQSDRAQTAPSRGLQVYLSERLTPDLITRGREKMREHRRLLDRIERYFGVQRRFVVAIWGAETGYGPYTGDVPVFQALATLAWEPRRAEYFRAELFDALRIVQRGQISIGSMVGSWAGAMGQPQFMPSSYIKYAFDFDRDGRRDIWRSIPDTLASIANYLRSFGWRNGETWGREISLTTTVRTRIMSQVTSRKDGCGAIRTLTPSRTISAWAADGVRLADGRALPRGDIEGSLVLTADPRTFLVYHNYESILAYNCSHYYAISVAMLADAIR
jgi:membrane-bound lytic murein transglycosylase B